MVHVTVTTTDKFREEAWWAPQPAVRSSRGVHCWKSLRLFIEELSPPYRFTCTRKTNGVRCGAVNEEK